ncbi:beta-lactamase regulating signal transducer with metallopeptidase domain [Kineothrix alysoides]|uniref:Beta-lactamase regulating signal transducer with metallopeptidase domain n=1 Tax=Kineothrix alysoides TaxID=1469948 RepID=A0A4R1QU70_9FIRM|nr:M56 family metallopeptidase [Kineothrix alysoides]TCL57509.1 beta-lactamase regulating signal transducer with metallopeptidase domain [Kineothrix alysoides]
MEILFLKLLNMSISASWMILAVIVLRGVLYRAPKSMRRLLWLLVGIRLICPFSIESAVSLIPNTEAVQAERIYFSDAPVTDTESAIIEAADSSIITDTAAAAPGASMNPFQIVIFMAAAAWIIGMLIMFLYTVVSWMSLRRRVCTAIHLRDNIWQSELVDSPFILGLFHPHIYIPSYLDNEQLSYVIAHENSHIRHCDHWIKPVGFLLLGIYWFNPFIWLAYILLCRDIEFACDERVIKEMNPSEKKAYSSTLLSCSITRKSIAACPLAFGENSIKARIKLVLSYKKPTLWIMLAAVISCIVVGVCFLTNPRESKEPQNNSLNTPDSATESSGTDDAGTDDLGTDGSGTEGLDTNESDTAGLNADDSDKEEMNGAKQFVEAWGSAFCHRDGNYIAEHISDDVQSELSKDLLVVGEGYYSFGFSSPWPMFTENDYHIESLDEDKAEIIYYAWTSEPHVTVWRETIKYTIEDGVYTVIDEELLYLDHIHTAKEFTLANPEGVITRMMDYQYNGAGEVLNQNALSSEMPAYTELFEPDRAAIRLLNLLDDPDKVKVTADTNAENTVSQVVIYFKEDGTNVEITMIKPFGKDGIWVPKTRSNDKEASEYITDIED